MNLSSNDRSLFNFKETMNSLRLGLLVLPTLSMPGCAAVDPNMQTHFGAQALMTSHLSSAENSRARRITSAPGYPLADGWKWGQANSVDFGGLSQQQVADALDSAFDSVKGTKLLPNVPWKQQHAAYTAKADEAFESLPFKGNEQLKLAMRAYANHTVFGASYKYKSVHPSVYCRDGEVWPSVGTKAVNSPVVQKIINNNTQGGCMVGETVFIALNQQSGIESNIMLIVARKYGQIENLDDNSTLHTIVNMHFKGPSGRSVAVLSNSTWAAVPGANWSQLQSMPNAQYLMVGLGLDNGATDSQFFFQHLFHESPDASPVRFTGGYPTVRQSSRKKSDPKIDPIAKEYVELNRAILSGR